MIVCHVVEAYLFGRHTPHNSFHRHDYYTILLVEKAEGRHLVDFRVFDFGMHYIRTVIQNAPRNKTIESPPEFWDGRDDSGKILPNGVYFYRVDVNDEEPLFGKIIYLQ